MKAWAITVILALCIRGIFSFLLPRGEKSPFYKPLRFLAALILLLVLISPFLSLLKAPASIRFGDFAKADEGLRYDPASLLLERSRERIEERIRSAFPTGDYRILFDTDESTSTITSIRVITADRELGKRIHDFLIANQLASPNERTKQ